MHRIKFRACEKPEHISIHVDISAKHQPAHTQITHSAEQYTYMSGDFVFHPYAQYLSHPYGAGSCAFSPHTHTQTHAHTHTRTRAHVYPHTHMHTHTYTQQHIHKHMDIHTYTHTCAQTHVHTHNGVSQGWISFGAVGIDVATKSKARDLLSKKCRSHYQSIESHTLKT